MGRFISKKILKEIYWILIIILASYLVLGMNSSFSLQERFLLCGNEGITISKISMVLQLAVLMVITRMLFHMVMSIEKEFMRFFLLPIVLFAFPVSLVMLWFRLMGC
ncbi:MAG: hypothetical protein K2X86_18360 [Cytophagaceae bacterium]|nr:hypothetical protein [Cytophagaceae bacterium]